ncbi:MAG: methionine--tRNA ligase [archaeon GB-1867-005]|nr:methionine--tRNA ligase [Candidatus Culexmicrobium cathedralense]
MGKWVICGAWPYVNAIPHLGTLIACVVSPDVLARYLRLKGEEVVFVSGSDEHGTPIEVEARRRNISPKVLTDELHNYVVELFKKFGISYDNYTRTENPVHIDFVRKFFMKLYENGYVYEKNVSLPYCENCKTFLPDRFVEGKCPYCGYPSARGDQCDNCGRLLDPLDLIDPYCVFCKSPPIIKSTKHWFFDLPKLTSRLAEFVENHPRFPDNVKNYCKSWLKEGLKARSVTRDNEWGIPAPFPGAEGKTIYVWFEALLGYLSATLQYFINQGEPDRWKEFWLNSDARTVYFIGKDNIPFHAIILPAMLIASGENYVLPWQISAIEYLMFEGQAFSKSRGIGVWLDEALELFEADYWRFALIMMRPEVRDLNFTWKDFYRIVNAELNDNLGNFVHRTLTFIYRYFKAKVPEPAEFDVEDEDFVKKIERAPSKIGGLIMNMRLKLAAEALLEFSRQGNQYINVKEPWRKIKVNLKDASTTLWLAANAVKSLAILMEPFMPFTAEKLWSLLKLEGSVHDSRWDYAAKLTLKPGHEIAKPKLLFKKLPDDFLNRINAELNEVRKKIKRPFIIS